MPKTQRESEGLKKQIVSKDYRCSQAKKKR